MPPSDEKAHAKAFERAVRSHGAALFRFAWWLTRDPQRAEDLVQESLQRAWKGWITLDETARRKWLFTIVRHEFLRRLERKQLDTVELESVEIAAPAELERSLAMRQALARMPSSLREPLVMQVLGGFSSEELAQEFSTTAGAMLTRLSRARSALRDDLEQAPLQAALEEAT